MNVAGGAGGSLGDLPIFISGVKTDSPIGLCSKIQVSLGQSSYLSRAPSFINMYVFFF